MIRTLKSRFQKTTLEINVKGVNLDNLYLNIALKGSKVIKNIVISGQYTLYNLTIYVLKKVSIHMTGTIVATLSVNKAYGNVVNFLEKFFLIKLSVSAAETIAKESSQEYEDFYD